MRVKLNLLDGLNCKNYASAFFTLEIVLELENLKQKSNLRQRVKKFGNSDHFSQMAGIQTGSSYVPSIFFILNSASPVQ